MDKIENLQEIARLVNRYADSLEDIRTTLQQAEKCFRDGGYIDRGETFDRGHLNSGTSTLRNNVSSLNDIANSINNTIYQLRVMENIDTTDKGIEGE